MASTLTRFGEGCNDPISAVLSLPKFGAGIGLHRVLDFAGSRLDPAWFRGLNAIKVTGSKGKGSVCAIAAEILRELGISTGLYTSPHLISFSERIRVNGAAIPDDDLAVSIRAALDWRDEYERRNPGDCVGSFEAITAAALDHFGRSGVTTIVSEAGLGGRYDSTRVIPGRIAALTSLELEHTAVLGNTVERIAYDKADLCPEGGTLIAAAFDEDITRRLEAYSRLRNMTLVSVPQCAEVSNLHYDSGRMHFDLSCDGLAFTGLNTGLLGRHQAQNAALAVLLVKHWLAGDRIGCLQTAVPAALENVSWPGRLQFISSSPPVIIDVGHTPQSLRCVAETMREIAGDTPILLVTGVSHDKQVEAILSEIVPVATGIICTRAYHKGAPVSRIVEYCETLRSGQSIHSAATIGEAMDLAVARARSAGMMVLVAGGLFLSVEAWYHLQGRDPRELHFF